MAKKKFDLGEFLSPAPVSDSDTREQITYLPLAQLNADEKNFYSMDGIGGLAANIELCGLQQPVRVRREGDGYTIVSGHRRCAAMRVLVQEGKERFADVPCIIETGEDSSAMRELRLIYANSDTRTISGADLAKQAERVQELLYTLKEEGVEFPGRMRDHVAEACKISATKLANLTYINGHLAQDFLYLWEKNRLPEATALELAHFEPDFQQRLALVFPGGKNLPPAEKLATLRKLVEEGATYEPTMTCPSGKACTHGDAALRRDACASIWESKCKGEKCCLECSRSQESYSPCERMCSAAKKRREEKNKTEKAKETAEREKKLEKNFKELQATCARMVRAADAAGLDDKVRAHDGYYGDGGHEIGLLRRYARGEFNDGENPYFLNFDLTKCSTLAECARTLHCSTDYLLGLTDELSPAAAQPTEVKMPEEWVHLSFVDAHEKPPRSGEYYCGMDCEGVEMYDVLEWNEASGKWTFSRGIEVGADVFCWFPLPKRRGNAEEDDNDT